MHELSIAQSIVELAQRQISNRPSAVIEEIELEIGTFSGVEMPLLTFALESAVKGTSLQTARIVSHNIQGEGYCMDCATNFVMEQLVTPCPNCGSYGVQLIKGRELRLKSIVIK